MPRLVRGIAAVLCLIAFCLPASAEAPAEEKWSLDLALTVTPREAPVPAFRYRLFPLWSERKPGDAAPIYLRFAHERREEVRKDLVTKPAKWNDVPFDQLPLKEIRDYVNSWKYNLQQMDLGARRKSCDWNYTLDVDNVTGIVLPDAQEMRMQGNLLILKARLEVAEGKYADALRTMETGFAFSNHVGEGAFLINGLIGIYIANRMADRLPELMQRPDAPNLYWALTALPRPLIDLRKPMDVEQRLGEMLFPILTDLERPRSAEEWTSALNGVVKKLEFMRNDLQIVKKEGNVVLDLLNRMQALPAARKYLTEKMGLPAKQVVEDMPPAQVLLLHMAAEYRASRDDAFKAVYLPYPQARIVAREARQRRSANTPVWQGVQLLGGLIPAIETSLLAHAKLERKIAALRVVEALRLHAAANDGKLPATLDQVKVVPIPLDPCTGRAFDFKCDGDGALITSQLPGDSPSLSGLRIRVTLKK